MPSDNSPVGVLVFLGFATRVVQCFSMLNVSDGAQDCLWNKDQGVLAQAYISFNVASPRVPHGVKETF